MTFSTTGTHLKGPSSVDSLFTSARELKNSEIFQLEEEHCTPTLNSYKGKLQ